MNQKIYITGIGIISAIGDNVAETLDAVAKGKSGIGELDNITTRHRNEIPIGEVKHTNPELIKILGLPEDAKITRTSLLGMVAAKEAMVWAGIKDTKEFFALMNTKIEFIKKAAEIVDNNTFVWVDFGILKIINNQMHLFKI